MNQKFVRMLYGMPLCEVRSAFVARVRAENERIAEARAWLVDQGYVELANLDELTVVNAGDVEYLPDGRVLIRAQKKLWALSAEIWAQRQSEAMEQARQRDAAMAEQQPQPAQSSQPPTICTSLIDGQLCGGSLALTPVCPKCALGKSGVAATLTCDVCGHVTAIMRGDG